MSPFRISSYCATTPIATKILQIISYSSKFRTRLDQYIIALKDSQLGSFFGFRGKLTKKIVLPFLASFASTILQKAEKKNHKKYYMKVHSTNCF
jgi:hypothetical protein